jgi:formylglycine-generating enzyme required for sulfatase activity
VRALKERPGDAAARQGLTRALTATAGARYEKAMAEGLEAEKAGDAAKAAAAYRRALEAKPRDEAALAALAKVRPPDRIEIFLDAGKKVGMELVRVRPGTFTMGDEKGGAEEKPHEVTITRDYWIQATEVTQEQWETLMGSNPSTRKGKSRPVESVTWEEAQKFLEKLAAKIEGRTPSLPTEAEWEYACRAGSTGSYGIPEGGAITDYAWFSSTSGGQTLPVGRKKANAWGLFDMHGNVAEWCADWHGPYGEKASDPTGPEAGTKRVVRGGSYAQSGAAVRAAYRLKQEPGTKSETVGFRVVVR